MPILDHVIGTGISPFTAGSIVGGPTTLLPAGTSLATGTLIGSGKVNVAIVSSSGKGLVLPACSPGSSVFIYNGGANTLTLYPNIASEKINAIAAGSGFALASNKALEAAKLTSTQWATILTA